MAIVHAVSTTSKLLRPGNIAVNSDNWTASGDTGFALSNLARAGGGIRVVTDGTDNDCGAVSWSAENVSVGTVGTRFGFSAVIKGTEGNTDDQDWFIGLADVYDNTFFSDADALASMDAIGFYKVNGSMFFRTCVLNAAAQSGETTTTAYASATEYNLRVEGEVLTLGITVRFYVNDVLIDTVTGVSTTGFTDMACVVALANGGANAETFDVYAYTPYAL